MNKKILNSGKSKFSFSDILKNNRILMIVSLAISFGLWVWVSVEKSPITQKIITDVPVSIDLTGSIPEQLNLQIFGDKEFKVDVTVSGKKYVLASIDKDNLTVSAITNYVDSSGTKTLQLKCTANGTEDFDIVSLSSSYIEVFFDTFKQIELPLETKFTNDIESLLPENCILGEIVFSKQSITISGPATEINRISKAVAYADLTEKLEKNTTVIPEIVLVTEDGSKLTYAETDKDSKEITMSIPVLKIVTLPASVSFKNAPSAFATNPLKYSVYPSTITAAVPIDLADTTKSIPVAVIDFAEISNGTNAFNISSYEIPDIVPTSGTASKFRITVDASSMSSKIITVPASKVRIINAGDVYDVKNIDKRNISFTVVGDSEIIDGIDADSLSCIADLKGASINENTEYVTATASVSNGKCWISGKNEIKVSVIKK